MSKLLAFLKNSSSTSNFMSSIALLSIYYDRDHLQADTGSSLAEALRCFDQLRLQLGVLEKMPRQLERNTITRYKACHTDINENEFLHLPETHFSKHSLMKTKKKSLFLGQRKLLAQK